MSRKAKEKKEENGWKEENRFSEIEVVVWVRGNELRRLRGD